MTEQELNQLMKASASDAVKISQEEFELDLDYSAQSIPLIDDALMRYLDTYKEQALENKAIFTLCNVYGAYIGETYKKLVGGTWKIDDRDPEAPSILMHVNDNSYAFAGICYEKLVKDNTVSIASYFQAALNAHFNR